MGKPIDAPYLAKLPKDRCQHCKFTSLLALLFQCAHPDSQCSGGYDTTCSEDDYSRCPLSMIINAA